MNGQISMMYADRMQFIVATMTKDYDKARDIANTILKSEPGNTTLRNYLPILEKAIDKRKLVHDDADITESDSELSIESNSDSTSISSDSNSDSSCENTGINKKERDLTDNERKKFCQGFGRKDLVFDSGIVKTAHYPSNRYNLDTNKTQFRCSEFKGKVIRVLPIKLTEKITGMK